MFKGLGKVVDGIAKSVKGVVSSTAQFKEELSWDLEGEGVALITAQTQSGELELQGSDLTTVTVKADKRVRAPTQEEAEAFASQIEVKVELEDDEVVIDAVYPEPPPGVEVTVSFKITAPRSVEVDFKTGSGGTKISEVEGRVTAETGSGAIKLAKCKNAMDLQTGSGEIAVTEGEGQVAADTGSGGIKLQKIVGNAVLHTASGKIRVTGIEGTLEAKSDSGGITARNCIGAVDLQATSGRISAELQKLMDHANFQTSNGSINIKIAEGSAPLVASSSSGGISISLPVEFSGELDAKSASGTILCQFAIVAETKVKGHLKGRIGDGEGASLDLQTSSGSIQVTAQGKLETKI